MLINDGREVTQQVNQLLSAPRPQIFRVVGQEAEVLRTAYVFGHYDSRGGAVAVVGQNDVMPAMVAYNRVCGWPDLASGAVEDLMTPEGAELHFIGGAPQQDCELDVRYDGQYLYARVQTRWWGQGSASEWEDAGAWVLFKVPEEFQDDDFYNEWDAAHDSFEAYQRIAPFLPEVEWASPPLLRMEARLMPDNLGEDASGLWLCRVPAELGEVHPQARGPLLSEVDAANKAQARAEEILREQEKNK